MSHTAASFIAHCAANGIVIERARGGLITVSKPFTPGDNAGYAGAETDCSILYDLPSAGEGSVWGTTGDGMGGMIAIQNGRMRLNKSNVAKRFVAAVAKLAKVA